MPPNEKPLAIGTDCKYVRCLSVRAHQHDVAGEADSGTAPVYSAGLVVQLSQTLRVQLETATCASDVRSWLVNISLGS